MLTWNEIVKATLGAVGGIIGFQGGNALLRMWNGEAGTKLMRSLRSLAIFCCRARGKQTIADSDEDLRTVTRNLSSRMESRLQTIQFQTALANSQIDIASSEDFVKSKVIDNSACHIVGFTNPVRLWAAMINHANDAKSVGKFEVVLQLLIRSGAQKFMNEIDAKDGSRPIDIALWDHN